MKKICILLLCCCLAVAVQAQKNGSIKGNISDTLRQPVTSATVTLLQKKDSSLVSFTLTDGKGYFALTGIANGNYRLLITHLNFHNAQRFVTVSTATPQVTLHNITLHDRSTALKEVVINAEAPPVTIVGDTIQYNAGSFKTPPNATVEQLLKKMPGIRIDKEGKVKAQGQEVKKVLVDGKEFFGNDPKIATKNLPADAVDKVQVFDRLSDAAQLTGLDDGNSEKTINLKLKQDKKKGLFGKASAGAGTNGRYEGRANINTFKGARQLSAIGMANNTNADGFSFMDLMNFSGEMNRMRQGGSGDVNVSLKSDDPIAVLMGNEKGNGIKTIWSGGVNYNNLFGNKTAFNGNYFYNRYNPHIESELQRHYSLPDSSYFYRQQSVSDNLNNSHRVNLAADIQVDSFHSVKITSSLGYRETRVTTASNYETQSEDRQPANEGFSNHYSGGQGRNFRNEVLFRKKFHRKGRTFSLHLQSTINSSNGNGSLFSINQFYAGGAGPSRKDTIQQHSSTAGKLHGYQARAVYTEPLSKRALLEFSLGRSHTNSTSDKTTYDFNRQNEKYDELNDLLSNNFENTYGYTKAGLRLRFQQKKLSLAAGFHWQQAALEGKIIAGKKDSIIRQAFGNLLPSLRFKYNFTRHRHVQLTYDAYTRQPEMSQLQPVPDISDPLNIREGNPDLQQELTHEVQLNFFSVNPFKYKSLFAFITLQQTQHKIVNDDTVDSLGVKRSRPVNVNGVYNVTASVDVGLPLPVLQGSVNFSSNAGFSQTKQFINTVGNIIRTFSTGPAVRVDLNPSGKISMSVGGGFHHYQSTYSLQSAFNNRYFSQRYEGEVNWELPANFFFTGSFTYTVNSNRAEGFNVRVPLWNMAFSRQFLRFNRGELKLSVFDLLNRNADIHRLTNQNFIEDSRTQNLRRFFLLSFTYSLSKNGLPREAGGGRRIGG